MRVFKTKSCARSIDGEIDDRLLVEAVREIEKGLVDADLGGQLIKKRVARSGGGKRSGYRTLIAYRADERAVFLFAFAKNERDNVTRKELEALKDLAEHVLAFSEQQLAKAVAARELIEVDYEESDGETRRPSKA